MIRSVHRLWARLHRSVQYVSLAALYCLLVVTALSQWPTRPALLMLAAGALAVWLIAWRARCMQVGANDAAHAQALVQHAPDLLLIVNDGRITFASPSSRHVLGYSPSELRDMPITALVHPDDHPTMRQILDQTCSQLDRHAAAEVRGQRFGGDPILLEVVAVDLTSDGDVGALMLTLHDVTGRKHTENALRASEQRNQLVARATNDVLWDIDLQSGDLLWNGAIETIFGYPVQEIKASTWWDERVHPDDAERVLGGVNRVLEQGGEVWSDEYRFRCANGSYATVIDRCYIVRDDSGKPVRMIGSMMDITARKALEEQIQHQAFHDPLTSLPNRVLFMDRLTQAIGRASRGHGGMAVLFLDLDNFKVINDSLGHHVGDRLLINVAERIQSCLRVNDTAARLGGDEFTMLLEDINAVGDAMQVAHRVIEQIKTSFSIDQHEVYTTPSIGLAMYTPEYTAAADLLRDADLAMYRAKSGGKAGVEVFDRSLTAQAMDRLELEMDLRRDIERNGLHLEYQPVVDLQTGRVVEVEALLRWQHPQRGMVPPSVFIALAEETGLIIDLGWWVLREACHQLRAWHDQGIVTSPLVMSVNLSSRQFPHPMLADDIREILAETGVAPTNLKLEITESVMMQDAACVIETLARLNRLGVTLAVDDFGTGYSSLSYLKRFPIDVLKIDRSFVAGLGYDAEDTAITHAIVTLAHTLNLSVTAEGIETVDQLFHLRMLGCLRGQGYYFARPMAAAAFAALLERGSVLDCQMVLFEADA